MNGDNGRSSGGKKNILNKCDPEGEKKELGGMKRIGIVGMI